MRIFLVLSAAMLSGCGALVPVVDIDKIPPSKRQAVDSVQIYNQAQLSGLSFRVLNVVEGISCKNKIWDAAATKANAVAQARYWALELGANGVTNLQCDHPRGTTTTYNCWESITCTAEAIVVTTK